MSHSTRSRSPSAGPEASSRATAVDPGTAFAGAGRQETTRRRGHLGLVVIGSWAAGIVTAVVLVAAPFVPATESALTSVVLFGAATGWGLLVTLSAGLTDQPQRWAAAPAVLFLVTGLLVLLGSSSVHRVLGWVWPLALLGLVVWIVPQARARMPRRLRRGLLYPVLIVLLVASLGACYERFREVADAAVYPRAGEMVAVGGHRLHLTCTGSGSPTVVLEPGLGETAAVLGWLTPAVARDSRVCVYDRAGRGWSDSAESTLR